MILTISLKGDIKKLIAEVDLLKHHMETHPSDSHNGTLTFCCDTIKVIELFIFDKIQQF